MNTAVWVVMYHSVDRVECQGIFRSYDRAEEFVVGTSTGALVKSVTTDSLYVCNYIDGIHHMTSSYYTIMESPIR